MPHDLSKGKTPHEDFSLACACLQNDRHALAVLETEFLAKVPGYLASLRADAAFSSDVLSLVRDRILPPPIGCDGKLAEYRGDGPLGAWLRVVAMRVALNLRRQRRPALNESASEHVDIERDLLKARLQPLLREHLSQALSHLPPRERALLRMYIFDDLTFEEMARAYGVNRSTVHRWIHDATGSVLAVVRQRLSAEAGIGLHEIDSVLGDLRSRLGLSLQGLVDQ